MQGQVSEETEVEVAASVVWEVYRGLKLGKMVDELLPHIIGRVELIEGDGGVGTVVKVTCPQGTDSPGMISYFKERFTVIDDEKRIKETELIEGGFKELGFHLYRVRLEIIEKDINNAAESTTSTIVRSTVEYEVDEEHAENASFVSTKPLATMAEVIGKHLAHETTKAT